MRVVSGGKLSTVCPSSTSSAEDKVGMMSSQFKVGPSAPPIHTKAVGGSDHGRPLLPFSSSLSISPSLRPLLSASPFPPSSRFSMRLASTKQAYICRDCGYIYNDRTPFEKLADAYSCPVCGAPKRRFKAYEPAVSKNANEKEVRKARKAQIQRDEAIGRSLPIGIAFGVVGLAGLYVYLNSIF